MAITVNSVTFQPLSGVNLTPSQEASTIDLVTDSTNIANRLYYLAAQGAYQGINTFSLNQALPNLPTADKTRILGILRAADPLTYQATNLDFKLSAQEWRKLADAVIEYANLHASALKPSNGGGIHTVNGKWYVNGAKENIQAVYMAVRINQLSNLDDQVAYYTKLIQANTVKLQQANKWINLLQSIVPTNTTDTATAKKMQDIVAEFTKLYPSINPVTTFMPSSATDWAASGTVNNQSKLQGYIQEVKSYTTLLDNDNQTYQTYLEQMVNKRGEVTDGLTSFTKSQQEIFAAIARNMSVAG